MSEDEAVRRIRLHVSGTVQGVGFRPFVFRLASELGIKGFVRNCNSGVWIEAEADHTALVEFSHRVRSDAPVSATVVDLSVERMEPAGDTAFGVECSDGDGIPTAPVVPDLAMCDACQLDIESPDARRSGYAFTNCTYCGPRYTIVKRIPYDRPNTTMARFTMCGNCRREYTDPRDRRFHAQPISCPDCGPQLTLIQSDGSQLPGDPVTSAAEALRSGRIVGLKGIGGFQLLCDARSSTAVARLRSRKAREQKPFAVMFPDLELVRQCCQTTKAEEELLTSSAAPIVLIRSAAASELAPEVNANSAWTGALLPCSPLHRLLLNQARIPVVATSGNRSEEPIAIDNKEALATLGGIADLFLLHDRPIQRPCDDSVVRSADGGMILRRARGYAPAPIRLARKLPKVLALGAHLKSTVAIAVDDNVILSQHLGDLDSLKTRDLFHRTIDDLSALYEFHPEVVACDLHPDYASTAISRTFGIPVIQVQHHEAHIASCAAENGITGEFLGIAIDGSGAGPDRTVWGGELFLANGPKFHRVGHILPFRLPGGEAAIRDARRSAVSLLTAAGLPIPATLGVSEAEASAWSSMLRTGFASPWTTSMGRIFDAVGCLAGIAYRNSFEGQIPLLLEGVAKPGCNETYPVRVKDLVIDWRPLLECLLRDLQSKLDAATVSARFHNTVSEWIVEAAHCVQMYSVVLSGGVFQNACLLERTCQRLREEGFRPVIHHQVPPNDGGIALGQIYLAALRLD